jgi:hypothetical protein
LKIYIFPLLSGRFDELVFVPPPNQTARAEIFLTVCRGIPIDNDVNLQQLAARFPQFFNCKNVDISWLDLGFWGAPCNNWRLFVLLPADAKTVLERILKHFAGKNIFFDHFILCVIALQFQHFTAFVFPRLQISLLVFSQGSCDVCAS